MTAKGARVEPAPAAVGSLRPATHDAGRARRESAARDSANDRVAVLERHCAMPPWPPWSSRDRG